VRAVYQGRYEGLGDAWQAFDDWIAANGVQVASELCERHLVGLGSTPGRFSFLRDRCLDRRVDKPCAPWSRASSVNMHTPAWTVLA
jgi:hypothetical protein